ncbi:MAG: menaquinone biosynthesis decarboxylase [Acidobacteriota bacterium]
MTYRDLRDFVKKLEDLGELKRIRVEVDPELEITEIANRVVKSGGPALLFEKVKGSNIPVLINTFGTERRMNLALETPSLNDLAKRLQNILDFKAPEGFIDKLKMLPRLSELAGFFPEVVRDAPCKEVIIEDNPSLDIFPIIKCWPKDGGRYITLPCVFTKDRETGTRNCGMYRMQVYDSKTTGMHWHIHKHGARHYRQREEAGERIELAVAIGGDPVVTFAAAVPAPDYFDEMIIAGFIRGEGVKMVKCETVDLEVPAASEIVLEGYVLPNERMREGPFGDHTGFYSLADDYPVFHLTCITHRKDPIYHATIVGRPPMEDCFMGLAIERLFLPVIKKQFPEIVDMHMPWAGVFHNLLIVSIKKQYPGHARKIMNTIWSMGQAMFTKCIVVVDEDVNVRDEFEVAWKVLNHVDPERDVQFTFGPTEVLDHASRLPNYGSRMGIDGTKKWKSEGFEREWPDEIEMEKRIIDLVTRRWKEYGL